MTTATKTRTGQTDMLTWLEQHPPAARAVYAALSAHPGSTATELADKAGVGRSTATKALATLEAAGHVRRTSTARTDSARRAPDIWQPAASTSTRAGSPVSTATRTSTSPGTAQAAARRATPTPRVTAPNTATTPAVRAQEPAIAPAPVAAPRPAPTRPAVALPAGKLRNGELTQLVMNQLGADPAQEWTVRDLWKILDRSQGAISNALERATLRGTVIRTCDAPRRYRLATAPVATPADMGAGSQPSSQARPARTRSAPAKRALDRDSKGQ